MNTKEDTIQCILRKINKNRFVRTLEHHIREAYNEGFKAGQMSVKVFGALTAADLYRIYFDGMEAGAKEMLRGKEHNHEDQT